MSYVYWEIKHIPYNNGWDNKDEVTLTSFYDPILNVAVGDSRDSFSFKLTNFNGDYDNYFNPNDKITIYRTINSDTVTTDDILMIGSIKDAPEEESYNSNMTKVEGWNFSESIMNAIVFADLAGLDIPSAIQEALESAANKNSNFAVTWHPDNPSVRSDGSAFPTLSSDSKYFNKPLKNIIEKYSTNQETGDGDYYWYVDNQNRLVWRRENSDIDHSFNSSTGTHKSIKIGKDKDDVLNFIILKGGYDPQGNQIQTRYVNWSSVAKNGMKYYFYVDDNNTARNLIDSDLKLSYGNNVGSNSYPVFPFTSTWISADTGLQATAADEDEYVEIVRTHIKAVLVNEGKKIADAYANGKLEVSLEFASGEKTWGLGTNISCTIPKISTLPKTLRVTDIQYTTTSDTFTLKEDEGTV